MVEFGRRIRRRRQILGLTQAQVAALIHMRQAQLSRLEKGREYRKMRVEQLALLTRALETSADYLLQLTETDPGTIPPRWGPGAGDRPGSGPPLLEH
jgi:transcriptional regulator with XRE-family HTH domain